MKLTKVAIATLFSVLVISCSKKDETADFSDLEPKKEAESITSPAKAMSMGMNGITIPIEDLVRWVMLETNPGVMESMLSSGANFVSDLGYESLDLSELFMAIERFFYISITDDTAERLNTVGDLVQYVEGNAFGDYSNSVYDDMGRTPNEAAQDVIATDARNGNESVSVSGTSTAKSVFSFSWIVAEQQFGNLWHVRSYDEGEGYRMADNTAILYRLTHRYSEFVGESRASFKPSKSRILIPISDLAWREKNYSTSISSDYKSGQVYVTGNLTNFDIPLPEINSNCTVRVH
jgi:acyl carrier protein